MTDLELTTLVRDVVQRIDRMVPGSDFEPLCGRLRDAGIVPDMHVGRDDLEGRGVVEWYAGQILDVLEKKRWFAVNSMINCLDKFAPEAKS